MNRLTKKSYGVRRGMKRFARRKMYSRTNMRGRYTMSNDIARAQCEYYDLIAMTGSNLLFNSNGQDYMTFANIINSSTSFSQLRVIYARYKITGVAIRASLCNSQDYIQTKVANGVPNVAVAFYPNLTGTSVGDTPLYNDTKCFLESSVSNPQTKYWKTPDNFCDGGSTGFGIWSQCPAYVNQIGQLSCAEVPGFTASSGIAIYNVRVTVYCLFADKNN